MVTVKAAAPLTGAVQRYPDRLPWTPVRGRRLSPASAVAATDLPITEPLEPGDSSIAAENVSFGGGMFQTSVNAPIASPTPSTAMRYVVAAVAANVTRLRPWPPALSSEATSDSPVKL